jgi:hypothetical protein
MFVQVWDLQVGCAQKQRQHVHVAGNQHSYAVGTMTKCESVRHNQEV